MKQEHDAEYYRRLATHTSEVTQKIQLNILEVHRIIELNELAAAQGWPPYLPSPAIPAEEEK